MGLLRGQRGHQSGVARGQQDAPHRADDVEGLDVFALPHVVQHQQSLAAGQQRAQAFLAATLVGEPCWSSAASSRTPQRRSMA